MVRVERAFAGSGQDYCVHALLKTTKGQVTAILAPQGYMKKQGLAIVPKDRVTVTGSFISVLGKPFLLAMEVTGDRTMKLREANGRPAWAVGEDWHVHSSSRKSHLLRLPMIPDCEEDFVNKVKLNFVIDALMFLCMTAIAGLGFLMKYVLLPGRESTIKYGRRVELSLFGLDRHDWGAIHLYLGFMLLALLVLHILLHWQMIPGLFIRLVDNSRQRSKIALVYVSLPQLSSCFPS